MEAIISIHLWQSGRCGGETLKAFDLKVALFNDPFGFGKEKSTSVHAKDFLFDKKDVSYRLER